MRLTFRPKMYAGEGWIGYRQRTALSLRVKWRKMGLPTLAEKVVDKNWTTTNWAINDGEVPIMTPYVLPTANVTRWKHKFGFHNRGVQWDTPMSRWSGEEKDWMQLPARRM